MFLVLWREGSKEDGEVGKELWQNTPGVCTSKLKTVIKDIVLTWQGH